MPRKKYKSLLKYIMSDPLNLAENPHTPPEQLQELLLENQKNYAVLTAIAVHPNMSKELLIELARNDNPYDDDVTDYFCKTDQNPVMNLLLLEHPNLVEDIYLACFDELPEFCSDPEEICCFDDRDLYREYVSFMYYLPDWFVDNAVKHKSEDLRAFVAGRIWGTQEKHIELLIEDESDFVRYAMACSPCVSDSVLEKLIEDEDEEVRIAPAKNKNTPASVLLKLARDKNTEVRKAVAENARCRDLNYYKSLNLRIDESKIEELIEVKNAFVFLMQKLAQDEDAYIREAVARNEHTPAFILEKLLEDKDLETREAAARNKENIIRQS